MSSEKTLVDEIRELRKVFDEINVLKNEITNLKKSIENISKPIIDENKIGEIVKCKTKECINEVLGGIEEELKNIPTPEWLEDHLRTCKDPHCKWCGVISKVIKEKLEGEL
jgi:hypothetical protein